ncbi:WD40 repeat-like protein [Linderina macrospora]|uniref:WD40 repeat-like protein n=1 Tax=Linderina macrospora TaxID=4868 RepID=A0ACC1J313_9FUNG|nr:WD40 repeat-like protein [Linderina macrospora]
MAAAADSRVAVGFLNDSVQFVSDSQLATGSSVGLGAAPRSLAISSNGDSVVAVLENDDLVVVHNGQATKIAFSETPSTPRAAAITPSNGLVAVGFQDGSVRTYKLDGTTLSFTGTAITRNSREITALRFSPTGDLLAIGDAGGKIMLVSSGSGDLVTSRWAFHTARIYSIAWSPDGAHAVSGSLDGHVIVWTVSAPAKKIHIRNVHLGGVAAVTFLSNDSVASTGADGSVKVFDLTY